nr:MAG TPA: Protein of unknown function (DUF2680) [Caudoviricetes sp.]
MVDMRAFQQFMQAMRGKDPNQILNQMISSGQITQQQLNQVQMQAKQMENQFSGMKKMFGFK